MKSFLKILFTLVCLLTTIPGFSQLAIEEQSTFLDSVLVNLSTSKNPENMIAIIDQQLNLKNSLIEKLKFEIVQIDKDIYNNEVYFERLNSQLVYEKNIYADLIVKAQRLNSLMHQNFDIFSFDNLYTTYRQFLYIKWLADYRKNKIKRINNLKLEIAKVVEELDNHKTQKNLLAEKLGVERSFIKKYSTSRIAIIRELAKTGTPTVESVKSNDLDSLKSTRISSRETQADSSMLFQIQKGYLIWPVHKATIINYFGEKPHPVFDKVTVKNDGLDFCVPSNSKVQCVYNGVVAKITSLPQDKYVVIVRHGAYFTVYNGLDHIKVEIGDELEKGDIIGDFETEESHSVFNFQIWQGAESLDPYQWLIKLPKKK